MLFNSYLFIFIFFPIVICSYAYLRHIGRSEISKLFLIIASLVFYGWWNPWYLTILMGSLIVNYQIGQLLCTTSKRPKFILTMGIVFNLLLLGVFKYADFILQTTNSLIESNFTLLAIALPLGISFFTFQQITYLCDCARDGGVVGKGKNYSLLNYSLFVTFFPQLIAGPIVHHREMMPQFDKSYKLSPEQFVSGFVFFAIGLFKKIIIADHFAHYADLGFTANQALTFFGAWLTTASYTFQIYFDFSAYADMAIGLALILGIQLPYNFNSPYKALSIQDFWRRWHITLSRFLRDYVYIPLGGNRQGQAKIHRNVILTFLIGGLWHGAAWTFVAWGALHGIAMAFNRFWSFCGCRLPVVMAWLTTFLFINITWVFFRAPNFDTALSILKSMAGLNGIRFPLALSQKLNGIPYITFGDAFDGLMRGSEQVSTIVLMFIVMGVVLMCKNSQQIVNGPRVFSWPVLVSAIIIFFYSLYHVGQNNIFIYWNF